MNLRSRFFLHFVFSFGLFMPANLVIGQQWAFVSFPKAEKIVVYSIDERTGSLEKQHSVTAAGGPAAMCTDKSGRFLYVVLREVGAIGTFAIEEDGDLTRQAQTNIGESGSYVFVHPNGKFLLSSFFKAGKIAVHKIKENGSLSTKPIEFISTNKRAHSIVSDPTGNYVFVSHTGPNSIFQFRFNSENGELSPGSVPVLKRKIRSGPRHLWFHPKGKFAFGSDQQGRSITSYRLNSKTGALVVRQSRSSLPSGLIGGSGGKVSTSDIELSPNGRYAYIANRGHDSIASFSIDQKTGFVTLLGHVATEKVPRSFNISPDGKYLIAAGQLSKKLAIFRIGQKGKLIRKSTFETQDDPWWVQIVGKKAIPNSAQKSTK